MGAENAVFTKQNEPDFEMILKGWKSELLWLVLLFILANVFDVLIFRRLSLFTSALEIQLHDTYLDISGLEWVGSIFLFIVTCAYLLKETVRRFSSIPGNIILAILLLVDLFLLFQLHKFYFFLQLNGGGTVYPPLSALPNQYEPVTNSIYATTGIFFICIEVAMVGFIYFLGFKTGRLCETASNKA